MTRPDAPVDITKTLPEDWTEDDKEEYRRLIKETNYIHPDIEPFIAHIGVIAYINEQKGKREPASKKDIDKTMSNYDLSNSNNIVYDTPYDSNFYLYEYNKIYEDKNKKIDIIKDGGSESSNLLEYSSNEIISNVIVE
jgi:hypothetical protein